MDLPELALQTRSISRDCDQNILSEYESRDGCKYNLWPIGKTILITIIVLVVKLDLFLLMALSPYDTVALVLLKVYLNSSFCLICFYDLFQSKMNFCNIITCMCRCVYGSWG